MKYRRVIRLTAVLLALALLFGAAAQGFAAEQHQITQRTPLLDEKGRLTEPGYCVTNLYDYDRRAIKARPTRIKEWDFYQISNRHWMLQVTVSDISLGGVGSFALVNLDTGARYEAMSLSLLTFGSFRMEPDAMTPHTLSRHRPFFHLDIDVRENETKIDFSAKKGGEDFKADLSLAMMPGLESLVMAVPFPADERCFYLNQKINSMPVSGTVTVGDLTVTFDPADTFALLDWGRGVWPYHEEWYWGNGTTRLETGDLFGFEIGWGFGDMSAATENTLFFNGKAHKIGEITMQKDPEDWLAPWTFTEENGRFEMTMTPYFDNFTSTRVLGLVGNVCHQVFGKWNGTVTLDDGTVLEIHDMDAFCELSDNRW
ncbi:MAG: DUF2804 domain-containing protein [Clostridia bacterium]|nr:DUF2804 domain-containing protein [Clostridia bacterium]